MTIQIVMPFYGRFDHLRVAVESVIAQDDPDWQLTIVDDHYPDPAPGAWASAISDERVRYVRNEQNRGVAGSFRDAADRATESHLVIMGCDDSMLPTYVGRMHELIQLFPDAAIIQPGVTVIDENGKAVSPLGDRVKNWSRLDGRAPTPYGGERLARSLLVGNWTYFPSICWNTGFLKSHEFRADLDIVLDLALQLEIIMDGGTMLVDDQLTFLYRRHAGSVSSWTASDGTRFIQEAGLFRQSAGRLATLGWNSAARAARMHVTSRLNAVTKLPQTLGRKNSDGRRLLLQHVFGR